jgi:hypothetical protein
MGLRTLVSCMLAACCGSLLVWAGASFSNAQERATGNAEEALFAPIAKVLMHQRCVNCHPKGERPRQGDQRRPHIPPVFRGADGRGSRLRCEGCHTASNNVQSGVPGSPEWFLAPASMTWEGLTMAKLCHVVTDTGLNGGMGSEALYRHMETDPRVNWAWKPGRGRETPPLSKPEFLAALKAWVEAGTPCPSE